MNENADERHTPPCTMYVCNQSNRENVLLCSKCGRDVHFECTLLPQYQISMLLSKDYSRYQCITCVKVSRNVSKAFTTASTILNDTSTEKEELQKKCVQLKKENEDLNRSIAIDVGVQKMRSDEVTALRKEIAACENLLKLGEEQKQQLHSTIKELKLKKYGEPLTEYRFNEVAEDLDMMLENIWRCVRKLEESSRKEVNDETKLIHAPVNTYVNAVKMNKGGKSDDCLTNLIKEVKFMEYSANHDEAKRSLNIIIHGKEEQDNVNDQRFLDELCKDIKATESNLKASYRIGRKSEHTSRPIKVIFKNQESKGSFMANLKELKKHREKYKNISITNDYNHFERRLIREWVAKAKDKTTQNTEYTYKVRGTPQKGLYFKKYAKVTSEGLEEKNNEINESGTIGIL